MDFTSIGRADLNPRGGASPEIAYRLGMGMLLNTMMQRFRGYIRGLEYKKAPRRSVIPGAFEVKVLNPEP